MQLQTSHRAQCLQRGTYWRGRGGKPSLIWPGFDVVDWTVAFICASECSCECAYELVNFSPGEKTQAKDD